MSKTIELYLIFTAAFFTASLTAALLSEWYGTVGTTRPSVPQPRSAPRKRKLPDTEIPLDSVLKAFIIWAGIHFIKKLLYYIPFFGIMQTKYSLWWADGRILGLVYYIFILFLAAIAAVLYFKYNPGFNLKNKGCGFQFLAVGFVMFYILIPISLWQSIPGFTQAQFIATVVFAPLLIVKMILTGKYIGIFTSILAGSFIVGFWKKLRPGITAQNEKAFIGPGIFIIIAMFFGYILLTGDMQPQVENIGMMIERETGYSDMVDAAHSLPDTVQRSQALRITALTAAGKGKFTFARSLAATIPVENIKNNTLWELDKKEKKYHGKIQ